MATFKEQNTFAQRQIESLRIRDRFPSRIPVIVERSPQSIHIPNVDRTKFLVPGDLSIGQFIFIIRKRLILPCETALFLFVNGTLPTSGLFMKELYTSFADKDGFLYCLYSGENVFGVEACCPHAPCTGCSDIACSNTGCSNTGCSNTTLSSNTISYIPYK